MIKKLLGILLWGSGIVFAMEEPTPRNLTDEPTYFNVFFDAQYTGPEHPELAKHRIHNEKSEVTSEKKEVTDTKKETPVDGKLETEEKRANGHSKLSGNGVHNSKAIGRAGSLDFHSDQVRSSGKTISRRSSAPPGKGFSQNQKAPLSKNKKDESSLSDKKEESQESKSESTVTPNVRAKYYWTLVLGSLATYIGIKAWDNYQLIQRQKAKLVQAERLQHLASNI